MPRKSQSNARLTEAARQLVTENRGLAYAVANRYARCWPEHRDDLEGAALLGLTRAALRYDPARGFKFSTYATIGVINGVRSWLREMRLADRPLRAMATATMEYDERRDSRAVCDARPWEDAEDAAALVDLAMAAVGPVGREILRCRADGVTFREIAQRLGCTPQAVQQRYDRAARVSRRVIERALAGRQE